MEIDSLIKKLIGDAFKSIYNIELRSIHLEHPVNQSWGDYSSNVAMVNAKSLGKNPLEIAKALAAYIVKDPRSEGHLSKVEAVGAGFLNMTLDDTFLMSEMLNIVNEGDNYGKSAIGNGVRIALEHSNVNPNKAAHVGHLRNAVIGQYLERVYEYLGYDVNVQYYSNDLGVQVSTSLLGIQKLGGEIDEKSYRKFDHYAWDVYAKISHMLQDNPALKKDLDDLMIKLDNRDETVSKNQESLARKILRDNLATFSNLGIDYDLVVYESSIKDMSMWDIAFTYLKSNPNVYLAKEGPSAGCWLIRMNESDSSNNVVEEDKIIVRSNGIPTYTGKDIAYHMWKFGVLGVDFKYKKEDYNNQEKVLYGTGTHGVTLDSFTPNNIVMDVIDVKQTYAIDAVKKSLAYLGFVEQSNMLKHINYGHVYLSKNTAEILGVAVNEKDSPQLAMSGRKGVGVKVDDFIEMVDKTLKEQHGEFPNKREIRNAAIKYDMLRYDTFQDVVFDVESALDLKGYSGAYVEYTHARACSLLKKKCMGEKRNENK